jgi:hypothetical protein
VLAWRLLFPQPMTPLTGRLFRLAFGGCTLVFCTLPSVARAQGDDLQGSVNGLYPVWEQTAILHPAGGGQVGHGHAQIGLGFLQLGTQPFLDLYGTYNLELKVALPGSGAHRTALVAGGYRLPADAGGRSLGDLHRPGFSNPSGALTLFPVSLAHSFVASERLRVHSAATALFQYGNSSIDRNLSAGVATMVAWHASWHWSARLHGGLWGFGVERQAHAGLSFAYWSPRVAVAAGYARQASFTGESRSHFMIDGALLFR